MLAEIVLITYNELVVKGTRDYRQVKQFAAQWKEEESVCGECTYSNTRVSMVYQPFGAVRVSLTSCCLPRARAAGAEGFSQHASVGGMPIENGLPSYWHSVGY